MPHLRTIGLLVSCLVLAHLGCGDRLIGQLPRDAAGGAERSDGNGDTSDSGADTSDGGADHLPDANHPDGTTGIPDLPEVCTAERWCWTHPLPTADRFVQAIGVGEDALWLLGASGAILHRRGGVWSTVPPAPVNALSIWVSAADDIWIGSVYGPYHWIRGAWERVDIPVSPTQRDSNAIWGCAPDNVWLVGSLAYNWNGTALMAPPMPIAPGNFQTVWGSGCNDVWAGALVFSLGTGRLMHWNGTVWTQIASQPAEKIVGTGPDDVWSLAQGQLHHWTAPGAGSLRDTRTVTLFPVGAAAVGTMNDSRQVSVFPRDGVTASPVAPVPDGVSALWGRAADDIWAVGAGGAATHWNGARWTAELPGWALTRGDAVKVTGSGPADLWAVVGGALLHGNGVTWEVARTPQQVGGGIYDVWAAAANDVWVLGHDQVVHHWDGSGWWTENPPPLGTTTPEMRAISGTGPKDVWVLRGANSLLHWDGETWISRQPDILRPKDIWAAGPGDLWIVGEDGVSHLSGDSWSNPRLPVGVSSTPFTAVAGSGPTDVWMLTASGYVLQATPDGAELVVALNSDDRVLALAPAATGGVWVLVDDMSAAGSRIYFMTGPVSSTPPEVVVAPAGLNDLWLASDGTLWAAGTGGALLRRSPAP